MYSKLYLESKLNMRKMPVSIEAFMFKMSYSAEHFNNQVSPIFC